TRTASLDDGLSVCSLPPSNRELYFVALDEALRELEQLDPRQAKVVELHFYAGLTFDQIAATLKIGAATAKRDWQAARLWLHCRIEDICEKMDRESPYWQCANSCRPIATSALRAY